MDTIRLFREGFDLMILQFDVPVSHLPISLLIVGSYSLLLSYFRLITDMRKLLSAFQAASPGFRAFYTRLFEIVAVAVH